MVNLKYDSSRRLDNVLEVFYINSKKSYLTYWRFTDKLEKW